MSEKQNIVSVEARTTETVPNVTNAARKPKRWLTTEQVLAKLSVSRTTLWSLQNGLDFPPARVLRNTPASLSGRSYYDEDEVEAWMAGRPTRLLKCHRNVGGAK